jgi:acetoin utilization protein AcuB
MELEENKIHLFIARDLISDEIPPLKTSDTGNRALAWMDELHIRHLPIVNNNDFLGLISESDILDLNNPQDPIGNHTLSLQKPFVRHYQHFYDVLKVIATLNLSVIPVLDDKDNYLGIITLNKLIEEIANMASIKEHGGLLVLELNVHDYSMSEIARIVESNDARILSMYISSPPDSTKIEVTLKINRNDLSAIIQTFNRFNYTLKATFHEENNANDYDDRYQSFMKYFDI